MSPIIPRRSKLIWLFGGLLAAALTYTLLTTSLTKPNHMIRNGSLAPDIQVTTLEGTSIKLSDYRGKGVLLNFWGSWCGPCVNEMPKLKEAYESGIAGVEVLAVNVGESKGTILEFAQKHKLTFPILTDPAGEAAEAYRVNGLPATFVVDAEGQVKQVVPGELTSTEQIKALLNSVQPDASS
ncbi:redoxin domain-containing protein [Paenibacillus rigui]|uniref:Thiol-disulfide oxidoreductase ResA n=1 Tax=Paenibacillus rigui TaxID=554312 RepID=A0A229UI53_9BACL|nr:redoxin domain-containing protein [Paenibacillus rigui]OXM83041.1 thiol-disulfide oxidoreductase ResA [Paenibacillus rigui]